MKRELGAEKVVPAENVLAPFEFVLPKGRPGSSQLVRPQGLLALLAEQKRQPKEQMPRFQTTWAHCQGPAH